MLAHSQAIWFWPICPSTRAIMRSGTCSVGVAIRRSSRPVVSNLAGEAHHHVVAPITSHDLGRPCARSTSGFERSRHRRGREAFIESAAFVIDIDAARDPGLLSIWRSTSPGICAMRQQPLRQRPIVSRSHRSFRAISPHTGEHVIEAVADGLMLTETGSIERAALVIGIDCPLGLTGVEAGVDLEE